MHFMWYYEKKKRLYMSECSLYDITKLRSCVSMIVLYAILFKWVGIYFRMLFIRHYWNGSYYVSEYSIYY